GRGARPCFHVSFRRKARQSQDRLPLVITSHPVRGPIKSLTSAYPLSSATSAQLETNGPTTRRVHTMKAVVCEQWGKPEEVLRVRDVPDPRPGPGQGRVRMLASPINPPGLLLVQGPYGKQPPLPCTPGFEGVGVVEEGSGFLARRVLGKRVAVLNGDSGNWAEQVVIPARQAVPVPKELTDEQAATFFVNPSTALIMTQHVLRVPR